MNNYVLTIQYDGTNYNGWQIQTNTKNTIQGILTDIISKELNYRIQLIGSGRTDAGVHALGQVANFHCPNKIDCILFIKKINLNLPSDIKVITCKEICNSFHSRFNAIKKTYIYTICNDCCYDVFTRKFSYMIEDKLDLNAMTAAAHLLEGTHDFTNFTNANDNKSKVRTIYSIDIKSEVRNGVKHIIISYTGDGFLYNMIRILTGTLIDVGLNQINNDDISNLLNNTSTRNRHLAGSNLPPCGLCLKKVFY